MPFQICQELGKNKNQWAAVAAAREMDSKKSKSFIVERAKK